MGDVSKIEREIESHTGRARGSEVKKGAIRKRKRGRQKDKNCKKERIRNSSLALAL